MSDATTLTLSRSVLMQLHGAGVPAPRRPCLVLYSGPDAGQPFALDPGELVAGRSPECALCFDHPAVSRRHAELRVSEEAVELHDLGSANGTLVNDELLTGPRVLRNGDVVRLGLLVLRYYDSGSLDAALHDQVYRQATVDMGTEVFNRRYFFDAVKREMKLAHHQQRPLSLVCMDLDHFKQVNDRHGHTAGDLVLREAAARMRASLDGLGVLARLGGEEFAVLLPHTGLSAALEHAERARRALADQPFRLRLPQQPELQLVQTLSAGVTQLEAHMLDPTDLLSAADQQLYASKHLGRNRVSG
jgi:diguanylate cyclase (GGDEF)-like protein